MPDDSPQHLKHVPEIIESVTNKISKLPIADRALVVMAAIEAIGWITAQEVTAHCCRNSPDPQEAADRSAEYVKLFTMNIEMSLPKNLQPDENID